MASVCGRSRGVSRRCAPTVADAMFARWRWSRGASSARFAEGGGLAASTAALGGSPVLPSRRARTANTRVPAFHRRALSIKANALTSLITGANLETRRRHRRKSRATRQTRSRQARTRPAAIGRTREARPRSLAAPNSRAHSRRTPFVHQGRWTLEGIRTWGLNFLLN